MPRVSVLMPVYNGEKFLREAIESVLRQTFTDFELLIINDGSTDGSLDIIQTYSDPRIRLINNGANIGLIATRNKGIDNARGAFIALLDCDDIAYPERLATQVNFLDRNPDFGMVGAWVKIIDENGGSTGKIVKYIASPEMIPSILVFRNYFCQSAVVIRKSVLPEGRYRLYQGAEDYDLWVRVAKNTRVWNLQTVLASYRVHQSSISFVNSGKIENYVREIICNQLKSINLEPSSKELDIHRRIVKFSILPDKGFIKKAEDWLARLYTANKQVNYYKSPYFEYYLIEKFLSIYRRSNGIFLGIWYLFRSLNLSGSPAQGLLLKGAFLFKYLLQMVKSVLIRTR